MDSQIVSSSQAGPIAGVLQPYVDNGTVAGILALVASKERILELEALGYADVAAKKPMRLDSVFWIASVSKPITATAVMMLVDEGKVKIDDPVENYLPEFKDQSVAVKQENGQVLLKKPDRRMTVRDLLRHTSGLPLMSPLEQPIMDRFPLSDMVKIHALLPLQSEPGACFQYSNAGMSTAGRIIEVASGMPYEDFLSTRLFEPLGMKDTTFWPNEEQVNRLVKVYKSNEGKTGIQEVSINCFGYPLNDRVRRHPSPGGGLFSTVSDILAFGRMFLAGGVIGGKRYISEASIREMSTRQTAGNLTESYGLGWWTPGQGFDHGGAFYTRIWLDPDKQLVMMSFMQHAGFADPECGGAIERAFREAAGKFH